MSAPKSNPEQQRITDSCSRIVEATLASVNRHIGADADEFDRGMPCYCALATFVTFVSSVVTEETRFRTFIDCVFSFADEAGIEHRGLLTMLATQRVDYSGRSLSENLAQEIAERLTSLEPPHGPVFRDSVAVAFQQARDFTTHVV